MMFHVERWQSECFTWNKCMDATKLFHVEQEVLTTVNLFL